jgi:hypothetical protein
MSRDKQKISLHLTEHRLVPNKPGQQEHPHMIYSATRLPALAWNGDVVKTALVLQNKPTEPLGAPSAPFFPNTASHPTDIWTTSIAHHDLRRLGHLSSSNDGRPTDFWAALHTRHDLKCLGHPSWRRLGHFYLVFGGHLTNVLAAN